MVLAAGRALGNIAKGIITSEGAILGKAWYGFKARKEIVAGIRTGLGLGAGIGSFINDSSTPFNDAEVPFQRNVFKANKFRQKYSRRNFSKRCRCRNNYRKSR